MLLVFDLEAGMCVCAGPHLLDLGDCLYAPNCFRDAQGRNIMLAWLQELRTGGGFDYAGCISLPRVLTYKGTTCSNLSCLGAGTSIVSDCLVVVVHRRL